jgi:long-subunit fatty acid transport protein
VTTQTFSERVTSPSFFSFVYPFKHAAVSIYYQQATNFKSSAAFSIQDELFPGTPATIGTSADSNLLLDQIGASFAIRLGSNVAVGASVRTSQLKLDNSDVFTYSDVDGDRYTASDVIDDSNRQVTFNGGILINPNGRFSIGGFYNQGGKYDLTLVETEDSSGPFFGNLLDSGPDSFPTRLEVPDYGGGGIAFRPNDRWILSADVVFVGYSSLSRSADELDEDLENDIPVLERVEDGVQFHFGTEYTFMSGSMPVSVRAGVYNDPDHDGLRSVDSDQIFGTFGAGFVIGGNFQIDFAANLSKRVKETLISAVWRF